MERRPPPPGLATSAGPGVPARELRPDSLGPGSLAAAGGVPSGRSPARAFRHGRDPLGSLDLLVGGPVALRGRRPIRDAVR